MKISWNAQHRFEKYSQIRELLKEGCNVNQAAVRAGVHPFTVRKVKNMSDADFNNYFVPNQLTPRERQIGLYLSQGFDNNHIAKTLSISVRTVEYHISVIYNRLDVTEKENVHKRVYTANALREIL